MGLFNRILLKRRLKRWRQELAINQHAAVFRELFQPIDGYGLSRQAREGNDAIEYVYGEIEFETFIALIALCKPDSNTVFYDLGSGTGKAVLACAMVFPVKKSAGIELFEELYLAAIERKKLLGTLPAYQKAADAVDFQHGDFLQTPVSDANLIFMNSTAFIGDYWLKVSQHLEQQLKPGAIVLSASKALVSDGFVMKHSTQVAMGWGVVTIFMQERIA